MLQGMGSGSCHSSRQAAHSRGSLTAATCLVLAFSLITICCQEPPPEIRIGLIAPLSGAYDPSVAPQMHHAALLAIDQVNARGGLEIAGRRHILRLVMEDSRDTVEDTLIAVGKLINTDKVAAIIGPYLSRNAIPAAALAEKAKIPMITPTSTHPLVTEDRSYVYRVCYQDGFQGKVMAAFAAQNIRIDSVAVIYDAANDYSRSMAEVFSTCFQKRGGAVPVYEAFVDGQKDFTDLMARVKASGVKALFLPNYPKALEGQIAAASRLDIDPVLLGVDSWHVPLVMNASRNRTAYFTSYDFVSRDLDGMARAFTDSFVERWEQEPFISDALTYDAVRLLLLGISNAGSADPRVIRKELSSVHRYEGITGNLEYRGSGDPVRDGVVLTVESGQPKVYAVLRAGKDI